MRSPGWLQQYVRVHESQLQPNEIPKAYQDVNVEGIPQPLFKKVAKRYLAHFWELAEQGKAPALLGRAGSGKTYTAACIAAAVRSALIDVAFVQCGAELQELERRRFDPWTNTRLTWLGTAPFVILDDVTKARANSFALDMLDGVVERRYSDGLPTVFTGNIVVTRDDDKALIDQFGVGFARRMREMTVGMMGVALKG